MVVKNKGVKDFFSRGTNLIPFLRLRYISADCIRIIPHWTIFFSDCGMVILFFTGIQYIVAYTLHRLRGWAGGISIPPSLLPYTHELNHNIIFSLSS